MTIITKESIGTGDGKGGHIEVPKGTKGVARAVSNSKSILKCFPELDRKPDGWFYLCSFPPIIDEILCDLTQIVLQ